MLKKLVYIGIVVSAFLSVGAFAHAPSVSMDPIGLLEYAVFPVIYDVTGNVYHAQGNSGLNPIDEVKLYINGIQESSQLIPDNSGDSIGYVLPWNIVGPGVYSVTVKALHGSHEGVDAEEVTVTTTNVEIMECPAAPAIAAEYMRSLGIRGNSQTWKMVMSLVSKQVGNGGSLRASEACATDYSSDVIEVIEGILPN